MSRPRLVELADGTPAPPGDYVVVEAFVRVYPQSESPVDPPIPPADVIVVRPRKTEIVIHVEGDLDSEQVAETVKKGARRGNQA